MLRRRILHLQEKAARNITARILQSIGTILVRRDLVKERAFIASAWWRHFGNVMIIILFWS